MHTGNDELRNIRAKLARLVSAPDSRIRKVALEVAAHDSVLDVAHPVNRASDLEAVIDEFFLPPRKALSNIHRRDEIFISGTNRRPYGGDWIAAITHYVGNFHHPLLGIEPSDRLAFLRSGEFYRIKKGRIVEAKLIPDFPDLDAPGRRQPSTRNARNRNAVSGTGHA